MVYIRQRTFTIFKFYGLYTAEDTYPLDPLGVCKEK